MAQRVPLNGKYSPKSSEQSSDTSERSGNVNGILGKTRQAPPAGADDIVPDKIMIAVVGPTGSGKSTFIRVATGVDVAIGDELEPCTSEISMIKLPNSELSENDIIFIDTPGFDTLEVSESDILKQLSDFLRSTFKEKAVLSGLLYFHRISTNRKTGFPQYQSSVLKRLVGTGHGPLKKVILVTTAWDEVDEATGESREEQLKDEHGYWKPMIDQGSRLERFKGSRESAFTLIKPFVDQANQRFKNARDLERKKVTNRFRSEIRRLGQDQQKLLREINGELKNPEGRANLQALRKEYEELKSSSNHLLDTISAVWDHLG